MLYTAVKVTKDKSELFEHTESISKRPARSVSVGNIIYYLTYLLTSFPRGLEVNLEGSSIFLIFTLSMHIDRLRLFSHLY